MKAFVVDRYKSNSPVDRIFPFEATKEAWAYLETGRAKGEVVIKVI